jgi:4-hydroxy-tetrahydrodipicolinate reductase
MGMNASVLSTPLMNGVHRRSFEVESAGQTRVGIHGALGRMGLRLIQLIADDPGLELVAAVEREGHLGLGQDAGGAAGIAPAGVPVVATVPAGSDVDVMVDFSVPTAALAIASWCRRQRVPLVVGTTGFESDQRRELEDAAREVAMLISPNMSRAVNLLMKLVGEAARVLGPAADIEILERHHRTKKDAPSGTALRLGEVAGRGQAASRLIPGLPLQAGVRQPGEIGIHALRVADCPGEHVVVFSLMGETLELGHRALNRDGFARGALDAAKFLAGKVPGLYRMEDVLG